MKKVKEAEYQKSLQLARDIGYVPVISCYYITRKCNYSCDYCSAKDNDSQDLPTKKSLEVVDKLFMLGNRNLSITGGEPYLREDIYDVIEYASSKNMKVVSVTNGSLFNSKIINRLDKTGLDVLGLGVESMDRPKKAYGKHLNSKKRRFYPFCT